MTFENARMRTKSRE